MTKRAEKLTILAARIMEYEEQLTKSATIPAYNDSIRLIKDCLDVARQDKELVQFWPIVEGLKIELKKLEIGEIMKRQFTCQELYKELVRQAAEEIEKK